MIVLLMLVGCAYIRADTPPAVLEGRVTVGPLDPVQSEPEPGVEPTPVPEVVFTSRSLNIYRADGKTLVKTVRFNGDGTYRVELPPGTYVAALPEGGIEFARELPKTVVLESGQHVELNLDIDTGIR